MEFGLCKPIRIIKRLEKVFDKLFAGQTLPSPAGLRQLVSADLQEAQAVRFQTFFSAFLKIYETTAKKKLYVSDQTAVPIKAFYFEFLERFAWVMINQIGEEAAGAIFDEVVS